MSVTRIAKIVIAITTISAAIMELIDVSIVNVALNQMAGTLGASIEDISWVITSYAIANVIIIPMTGFLAGYFGRKTYYMGSIVVFTLASVMCGQSTSIWMLVFWRFVQGLGGGGLLSTSQSILFDAFPVKQRGLAGALFGMGVVLGPTLGPTVGGLIIDNYAWPLIFNVNVPFGIIATYLSYRFIESDTPKAEKPHIDWVGIFLLAAGIGALQYVLERGESEDWLESSKIVWSGLVALIGLISFIFWELKQKHPVVNLRILKDTNLAFTTILTFIVGFALFTSVFVFPLLLQRILGYTALATGITLLPGSLLSLVVMPIVGKRLQAGTSPRFFVAFGFAIFMLFGILMSRADINVSSAFFAIPLLIRGAGLAMLMVPLTTLAVQGLEPKDMPQGIALNNMMRQLGGSFGIAIINNYVAQRYVIHRTDLVANIYQGSAQLYERMSVLTQGLQAKLPVTANVQNQVMQILDLTVMKQAYLRTYLDAFLFSSAVILAVFPILFFTRKKKNSQPLNPAEAEEIAGASH
ncbi:MAG: DHA2 family efflux MFS transporter permease subunit [Ignavibacteria bacterium]|nr:DHA2 family efflux MFS transporter permease subunit [Ignavibacteria bacterium]